MYTYLQCCSRQRSVQVEQLLDILLCRDFEHSNSNNVRHLVCPVSRCCFVYLKLLTFDRGVAVVRGGVMSWLGLLLREDISRKWVNEDFIEERCGRAYCKIWETITHYSFQHNVIWQVGGDLGLFQHPKSPSFLIPSANYYQIFCGSFPCLPTCSQYSQVWYYTWTASSTVKWCQVITFTSLTVLQPANARYGANIPGPHW